MKRLQNRVAESRMALPITSIYAAAIWLAVGLIGGGMWMQFVCFVVTTYLMVELNNGNALIRIYSRTVSCSFLLLSCAACFTFCSDRGAIVELCLVATYITLFRTYQDRESSGWTFYAFLCVGLSSLLYVHTLYYVPLLWLLMATRLSSFSWRTFAASLLGLATPYWFAALYIVFTADTGIIATHFTSLWTFGSLADIFSLNISQIATIVLILVLSSIGIVHYLRTSYNDKIRIRMFYSCFIAVDAVSVAFIVLQPQHYDLLIRLLIVNSSPLIAHFIALTHTRWTNWTFIFAVTITFCLTAYNLWTLL